ncbi:hypothetical protein [Streptomyces sp. Ag82_G6-1]|uniref:hypothetical protein n=1 Tax=Streptomyces sp. Ag82_G6-1 TaxID=1938853 RepID=UPI000BD1ACC0|nr:hypothetical protein SAMN06272727_3725 [Streptomyces sp. Ag82_G6-1]
MKRVLAVVVMLVALLTVSVDTADDGAGPFGVTVSVRDARVGVLLRAAGEGTSARRPSWTRRTGI